MRYLIFEINNTILNLSYLSVKSFCTKDNHDFLISKSFSLDMCINTIQTLEIKLLRLICSIDIKDSLDGCCFSIIILMIIYFSRLL